MEFCHFGWTVEWPLRPFAGWSPGSKISCWSLRDFDQLGFLRERFLFDDEALFDFLHVLGGRQLFGFDFAAAEELADLAVVLDELAGDLGLGVEVVALDAEVRDLVGEVFGFDRDRGEEVGQRAAFGGFQAALHLAGGDAAEEGLVAFGADAAEAAFVFDVFVDQAAEDLFGLATACGGRRRVPGRPGGFR